jgi:hypothetical protein
VKELVATGGAAIALCVVGVVVCVIFLGFNMVHKTNIVIRSASYLFCQLILVGGIIFMISPIAWVGKPTVAACCMRPLILSSGFLIMFGSMFAKSYRVSRIINNKKLRRLKITNADLLKIVFTFMGIGILICVVWFALEAPKVGLGVSVLVGSQWEAPVTCSYGSTGAQFSSVLMAYLAGFTLWGLQLAWATRNAPSKFNESKITAFVMYQTFLCSLAGVAFVGSLGAESPEATATGTAVAIVITGVGVVVAIFGTKVFAIYVGGATGDESTSTSATMNTVVPASGSTDDIVASILSSIKDNEDVKERLRELL